MKREHLLSLSAVIGALLCSSVRPAQAIQPLEEFLERSKATSFDARENAAAARQREAEADAALGRLLPSFSARGVYTRNQYEASVQVPGAPEPIVITPQDQLDAFLQLDVPLIDLSNYHRYRSAQALARAASEQSTATQFDVSRAVTRAYYNYLGAAALLRSARESVAAAEVNLRNVEARRGAGAATDLDQQRALANVERARQDIADAELVQNLAARNLETLSGLTPTGATEAMSDDLRAEAPLTSWLARAGQTPQERTAKALSEASAQSKKAADTALLPTLTGTAQERFTNATGFAGHSNYYTLQLTLAWRLDYGTVASTRALSASADVQKVREERTRRAVQDTIYEAYRRVETGIAKSRSARAQAAAANRAAELASLRYEAGVATQLDVTQAQREAFLADASRIQADADLAYARMALRLAAGFPGSPRK